MRFYLSQTVGDGTENNPFRPSVADIVAHWRAVDARSNATTSGLMMVECDPTDAEHATIIALPGVTHIPLLSGGVPVSLDTQIGSLDDSAGVRSLLESYQIPVDDLTDTATVKTLLQRMTKRFLVRQILGGNDVPQGLENILTDPQKTGVINAISNIDLHAPISSKARDVLKEIIAQDSKYLRTHYDN